MHPEIAAALDDAVIRYVGWYPGAQTPTRSWSHTATPPEYRGQAVTIVCELDGAQPTWRYLPADEAVAWMVDLWLRRYPHLSPLAMTALVWLTRWQWQNLIR